MVSGAKFMAWIRDRRQVKGFFIYAVLRCMVSTGELHLLSNLLNYNFKF